MFGRTIQVARILGIPLLVDYSWIILFLVVTAAAFSQFRLLYPRLSVAEYVAFGLATSILFFSSVVLHELAHSVLARRFGVPVKDITLFLLGGVSRIAQEAASPFSELVIALAGPFSSLVLAAFFSVVWMAFGPLHQGVATAALSLVLVNVALAVFNLIPGFPLDGGRVLRAILWWQLGDQRRATRLASLLGQGIAYLFMAGGLALAALSSGHFLINGIWLVFVGWFLERAAERSYRQELVREALQGYSVRNLMSTDLPTVPQDLTLRSLVDQHLTPGGPLAYLVVEGTQLRGTISVRELRRVAKSRWEQLTVGETMTPLAQVPQISPDADVLAILERMDEAGAEAVPVVEDGRVVGILGRDVLVSVAQRRNGLAA
ncbi:MAG: site-2 protease family protein [Chloroflexi bacterium]|nr:site-2 protease family protein [Chloroflexota bacterium]